MSRDPREIERDLGLANAGARARLTLEHVTTVLDKRRTALYAGLLNAYREGKDERAIFRLVGPLEAIDGLERELRMEVVKGNMASARRSENDEN